MVGGLIMTWKVLGLFNNAYRFAHTHASVNYPRDDACEDWTGGRRSSTIAGMLAPCIIASVLSQRRHVWNSATSPIVDSRAGLARIVGLIAWFGDVEIPRHSCGLVVRNGIAIGETSATGIEHGLVTNILVRIPRGSFGIVDGMIRGYSCRADTGHYYLSAERSGGIVATTTEGTRAGAFRVENCLV